MKGNDKKDILSTALKSMNKEHDMIKEILNKINYAYNNKLNTTIKKKLINELYIFLDFHFTSEENMLTMFDYPDYDKHKEEHDHMKYHLAEIIGTLDVEEIDFEELKNFIYESLHIHTQKSDAELTKHLKTQYDSL